MAKVAFLYDLKQPGPILGLKLLEEAAQDSRITVHPIDVTDATDFEHALLRI